MNEQLVRCPDCNGWGDDGNFHYCDTCAGSGRIRESRTNQGETNE